MDPWGLFLARVVSWMAGPFVQCLYCRQRGASLQRAARPHDRERLMWRCTCCGHARRAW